MIRFTVLREKQDVLIEKSCRDSSYNIKAWPLHALRAANYTFGQLFTLVITKSQSLPGVLMMRVRGGGSRPTTQHRSKAGFCGRRNKTESGTRQ